METNREEKLIIAKLNDKLQFCKTRNKITYTDFLNLNEKNIIQKELERQKFKNYIFTGGYEEAESKILLMYPEKLTEEIATSNIKNIIKVIEIILPNEQKGKYQHRDYLGTVMQFGIIRERMGDILVYEDKAYIIILAENAGYIKNSLITTTKFKKSKISIIDIDNIEVKEPEFDIFKITSNSMRLDNIVSEITKLSRNETAKLIESEKVSINCKIETKQSKIVNIGDVLIIRGKGKFIVGEDLGVNKKRKRIVEIKKYK